MNRTEDRISRTLDRVATTTTISPDALETMAARRRSSRNWGVVAGTGLVAAGLATVLAVGVFTRVGTPAVDGSGSDVMGSPSTSGPGTDAAAPGSSTDLWSGLTYVGAVDQLLELTDGLSPVPTPTADEDLTYEVASIAGWRAEAGDVGDMIRRTTRIDANGIATITTESLGEVSRAGGLDQWRAAYASADPVVMDVTTEDAAKYAMTEDGRTSTLAEAREKAAGSAEPDPRRTERPDQAYAFMLAADLLRGTAVHELAAESQRDALTLIRDLDPSLVSYEGTVSHLTGEEVVMLRARDRANNDGWTVLLFDAETGRFAGDGFQEEDGGWVHVAAHSEPRLETKG